MQGFGGIKINKNNLKTKKYGGGGGLETVLGLYESIYTCK